MKKTTALLLMAVMIFTLSACGSKPDVPGTETENQEPKYTQSLDVLNEVFKSYKEDERFAIYGGNQENAVEDAPGKFDISKTEELENVLGLPGEQVSGIDDAASAVHMMNGNTFTGAAYHLKDSTDVNTFADAVKSCILAKQWVCGQPDTLIIIQVDGGYVITAYGEKGIMETFKNNALTALSGAQVVTEAPVA